MISTFTQLANALDGAVVSHIDKASGGGTSSETLPKSVWTLSDLSSDDSVWPAAAIPSAAEALSKATVGAMPLPPVAAGNELYLAGADVAPLGTLSEADNMLVLVDRLVHVGGFSANITNEQLVNTPNLPRFASGEGVVCWLEIHSAVGTTAASVSVSYTNQDGVAGRIGSVATFGSSVANDAASMIRLVLQSGDTGVRSVQSLTLSGGTGVVGNFAVVLGKPLVMMRRNTNAAERYDWADLGLPKVDPNACVWLTVAAAAANRSTHQLKLEWIQG